MNEWLKHHLTHLKRRLRIRTFRSSLSSLEAAPQFALLGILVGLFTRFIIAFRWVVETTLNLLLPAGPESFEQLNRIDRFLLPVAGNLLLFMLLCIAAIKLIATAVNLGPGMPIGLIGPSLVIGALAGDSFWQLASTFSNTLSEPGF